MIPERSKKNTLFSKTYLFFFKICMNNSFNIFITICIVLNTILLAMDKFPMRKEDEDTQADLN